MRAFVVGGTGQVGRAIGRRLAAAGWSVDVVGRDRAHLPDDVAAAGVRFVGADRSDPHALATAFGGGADLLVDCVCFTRADARTLLPLAAGAGSTVMISSKAVYVDAAGRHSNSDQPARFDGPIRESQPTLAPADLDFRSREGYGPNKVAAEQALLDSGLPVTILRPSKIHGDGARPPREWVFVKRVLDRRPAVFLARRGRGVDHPSAAANLAALVETVAAKPGRRILNCADPDAPSGLEIARTVARHLGHEWQEILLDDDADPALGWHPWNRAHPVVLDLSAALELGYMPVGDYAATVTGVLDWLTAIATADPAGLPPGYDSPYFATAFDYAREDRYPTTLTGPQALPSTSKGAPMNDVPAPVTEIPADVSQVTGDPGHPPVPPGTMLLELVPLPVADLDRASAFYRDQLGFQLDVDVSPMAGMRIVQLTPPGSACSITLVEGLPALAMPAGSLRGLHLVVADIHAARAQLLERGVEVGEVEDASGVLYAYFADPDGNTWCLQYMPWR